MFKKYIHLRCLILYRIVRDLGFFSLIALGIVAILFAIFYRLPDYSLVGIFTSLILLLHLNRDDKVFLRNTSLQREKLLYAIDYLFISIPFVVLSLCKNNILESIFILMVIGGVSFLPDVKINADKGFRSFFTVGSYEFEREFRMLAIPYLLLLLVSVIGIIHNNMKIPEVAAMLWFFLMMPGVYLIKGKRSYMLNYQSVKHFVMLQIKHITANTLLLFIPFTVVFLFNCLSLSTLLHCSKLYLAVILLLTQICFLRYIMWNDTLAIAFVTLCLVCLSGTSIFIPLLFLVEVGLCFLLFYFSLSSLKRLIYANYQ